MLEKIIATKTNTKRNTGLELNFSSNQFPNSTPATNGITIT